MDTKRALAPLELVVSVLAGLVLTLALLSVVFSFFDADPPAGYVEPVCVDAHARTGDDTTLGARPAILKLAPDVTTNMRDVELCDASPSAGQRLLRQVVTVTALLYPAVALLLLWLLIRSSRRSGIFVPKIARGVGRLGLFVLVGGLAGAALQAWAASALVQTMTNDETAVGYYQYLDDVWTPLLVGFGLITLSRVLSLAVPMQRELDATV
jgi:hypothetical protein